MSHPFELELSDLEAVDISFEEQLTSEEAGKVQGGLVAIATTEAVGEEGGGGYHSPTKPVPSETFTAVRWGESGEGGGGATTNYVTKSLGEAGEEGGGCFY